MSSRTAIQDAVYDFVDSAASASAVIDIDKAAFHLSGQHTQGDFPLDELCQMIEAAAVRRGAVILSGRRHAVWLQP
jgi:hypothetical protein